jgi:peptidoglycan/LPS O-acetylase OafA/YrhL
MSRPTNMSRPANSRLRWIVLGVLLVVISPVLFFEFGTHFASWGGNTAFAYVGPVTLLVGLVLIWSRWVALAVFLILISVVLLVTGALQVFYGPHEGVGTAFEWGAPVLFLGGLGVLVWRVVRRNRG